MLTVHYFTASWCGPCKVFGPTITAFAEKNGIDLRRYDVDTVEGSEAAKEYGVMSLPTTIWFRGDQFFLFKAGAMTEYDLEEIVSAD